MSQNHLRNHLKSEFAQIPNALIEDRELSATARALFCYLAVKPDDWKFKMKDIADALLISIPTLRKVIAELSVIGWIDDGGQNRGEKGEFGAKIFSIYPTKYQKIGSFEECKVKKSPQRQKPASVKNRSGKNSALNNTQSKKYSKRTNTSSSSPPISEEDENELVGCEIVTTPDPYSELPENVEELPRQIVIDGINAIAIERGGDFEKYRDSLIREVLSGKGRTIANIRTRITRVNLASEKPWVIANRLKRQQGEKLSAALRASGHDNIFDYLEEMKHEKNA
jgi:hypothetical protein